MLETVDHSVQWQLLYQWLLLVVAVGGQAVWVPGDQALGWGHYDPVPVPHLYPGLFPSLLLDSW